ncbi:hypothetical protein CMK17_21985 [Candidatus Poribacteria bacterium]|nr:hypothetical protein [Candidatus Poribacteria bacterium]
MEGNPGKKLWKILRTSKRHLPKANPGARTVNCTLTVARQFLGGGEAVPENGARGVVMMW